MWGCQTRPKCRFGGGKTIIGAHSININPVGLRKQAMEGGIVLCEPFAPAGCSGLAACLEAGLTIKDYIWRDTCPRARAVGGTLLPQLMRRFPGQLSAAAIRGFASKLPFDIKLTGAMQLANLGQIDVVVGGKKCLSMSRVGKRRGMEDRRASYFFDLVRCPNYLQERQAHPPVNIFDNNFSGNMSNAHIRHAER